MSTFFSYFQSSFQHSGTPWSIISADATCCGGVEQKPGEKCCRVGHNKIPAPKRNDSDDACCVDPNNKTLEGTTTYNLKEDVCDKATGQVNFYYSP